MLRRLWPIRRPMTKITQSLTAQLRDVARAFCLEVWGQALTAAGVSTKLELRAFNRIYYPPVLRLAPNSSQPSADLDSAPTSSSAQPATTSSTTTTKQKEKEQPTPENVVDVEIEEAVEVARLKRKKKEKEQEKKEGKEKETSTQLSLSLEEISQLCTWA